MKIRLPTTTVNVQEKVVEEPVVDINEEIKEYITENKPETKKPYRDSINKPKLQADSPSFLTSKKRFGNLELIKTFVDKCRLNKLGPARYTGRSVGR